MEWRLRDERSLRAAAAAAQAVGPTLLVVIRIKSAIFQGLTAEADGRK